MEIASNRAYLDLFVKLVFATVCALLPSDVPA